MTPTALETAMTARLLVVVLLAAAGPARAGGVVIHANEREGDTTVYLDGKKLRFDEPKDQRAQVTIFDGVAHRLLQLDTHAHTYWETTEADGKRLRARIDAALAAIPPERREKLEAAMKQRAGAPAKHDLKFVPLGSHQEVAGFGCDGYRMLRDGKPDKEGCYIPWSAKAVARSDLEGLKELSRFGRAILANAFGASAAIASAGPPLLAELDAAPGFPAVLDDVSDTQHRNAHRVKSIERKGIAPSTFAIPAGYRKIENPMLGAAAGS